MTPHVDITHPDTIRYAIKRWEASKGTRSERGAGDEMAVLLRQILAKAEKVEPVLPPETFTPGGVPRRAASRAREHGAKIYYRDGGVVVDFPNGSWLTVVPSTSNGRPTIFRYQGAVPGCKVPEGNALEEILNNFADEQEGRA
jgi:hypothetical protein